MSENGEQGLANIAVQLIKNEIKQVTDRQINPRLESTVVYDDKIVDNKNRHYSGEVSK